MTTCCIQMTRLYGNHPTEHNRFFLMTTYQFPVDCHARYGGNAVALIVQAKANLCHPSGLPADAITMAEDSPAVDHSRNGEPPSTSLPVFLPPPAPTALGCGVPTED